MELSKVKILVDRYLSGEATLDEEQALAEYLASCKELDDELRPIKLMFDAFAMERNVVAPTNTTQKRSMGRTLWLGVRRAASIAAVACVAVVALGVAYSYVCGHEGDDESLVCYVDGVMVDDQAQALKESERVVVAVFDDVNNALLAINSITSGVSK